MFPWINFWWKNMLSIFGVTYWWRCWFDSTFLRGPFYWRPFIELRFNKRNSQIFTAWLKKMSLGIQTLQAPCNKNRILYPLCFLAVKVQAIKCQTRRQIWTLRKRKYVCSPLLKIVILVIETNLQHVFALPGFNGLVLETSHIPRVRCELK